MPCEVTEAEEMKSEKAVGRWPWRLERCVDLPGSTGTTSQRKPEGPGRSPLEALVATWPSQCLDFGSRASSLGEKESLVL